MTEISSSHVSGRSIAAYGNLPIAVFVVNRGSGCFEYANDAFRQSIATAGVSPDEDFPEGDIHIHDVVHPDDRIAVKKWFDLPDGASITDEVRFQRQDGQWGWFRVKLRTVESSETIPEKTVVGVADPLTDSSEDELTYHREFERLIIRASSRFVNATTNRANRNIEEILEEVCKLVPLQQCHLVRVHDNTPVKLSISHEYRTNDQPSALGDFRFVPVHIVSWLYEQISHPNNILIRDVEDLPDETGVFKKLLRGNNAKSYIIIPLRGDSGPWGFLGMVPEENSSRVWSDDTLSLMRIIGELTYGWLNRAQKDAEIKKSQQQWAAIASAASDLLAIVEPDGTIRDARFGETDISGQSIYDIVKPKYRKPLRFHIKEILSDPNFATFREFEYVGSSPDGKEIWYRGRLGPFLHDEPRVCVSLIATSIQTHKETEARSHALQSELEYATRLTLLGNMSVEVAHQFHQPLQVIESYVDGCRNLLQRNKATSENLNKALNGVSKAVQNASQIISQLQHFVRRREPRLQVTSINTIADNAVRLAGASMRRHNVELRAELTHGLPPVNVDPMQLTHVLLNLILNGIEAIHVGRNDNSNLTLTLATSLAENESIRVSVVDTGSGIAEEHRHQIFEQFFTTKKTGLGLGLAQSRNIIETHNGRLWIESSDNTGSEFCFELPAIRSVGHDTGEMEILSPEVRASMPDPTDPDS